MAFAIKMVIPIEIEVSSARVANYDEQTNSERQLANLDLIDKVQEKACIRMAAYQHRVARYFKTNIRKRSLRLVT